MTGYIEQVFTYITTMFCTQGGPAGIVLSSDNGAVISDGNIRCVGVASIEQGNSKYPGWKNPNYNDNAWPKAKVRKLSLRKVLSL